MLLLLATALWADPELQCWAPGRPKTWGPQAEAAQAVKCLVPLLAKEEQNSQQLDTEQKLQCNNMK